MLQRSCFQSGDMFASAGRVYLALWLEYSGFDKCAIHWAYFYSSEAPLSKNISLWLSMSSTEAREVMELRT